MAIRHVKVSSTLSYDERRALAAQTGIDIGYVRVGLKDLASDPVLTMTNGRQEQLGLFYTEIDETSHKGRVVDIVTDYSVRIMSDVWADITYAVVFEPNGIEGVKSKEILDGIEKCYTPKSAATSMFRRITIANSEFPDSGSEITRAEVDANREILEIYQAWNAGAALQRAMSEYDAAEHNALRERCMVARDRWVRIVRGKKVEKGTEGIVFWLGDSQWGLKVGVAVPQEDGTFRKIKKPGKYGKTFESYADVV